MTNEEFRNMTKDFDGFMEKQGFYTIDKVASITGRKPVSIRQRVARGHYLGSIKVLNKTYIPDAEVLHDE